RWSNGRHDSTQWTVQGPANTALPNSSRERCQRHGCRPNCCRRRARKLTAQFGGISCSAIRLPIGAAPEILVTYIRHEFDLPKHHPSDLAYRSKAEQNFCCGGRCCMRG